MAVNSFLAISEKCCEDFVVRHPLRDNAQQLEPEAYIWELIRRKNDETSMLDDNNKLVYF